MSGRVGRSIEKKKKDPKSSQGCFPRNFLLRVAPKEKFPGATHCSKFSDHQYAEKLKESPRNLRVPGNCLPGASLSQGRVVTRRLLPLIAQIGETEPGRGCLLGDHGSQETTPRRLSRLGESHTGMGLGHVPCEQQLITMTEALGSATRNCVTWVALYEWTRTPGM